MKNKEIFEKVEKELKNIAKENNTTDYYKNIGIFIIYDELNNTTNINLTDEEKEKLCDFIYEMYIEIDIDNLYTIINTTKELLEENEVEKILDMSIEEFEENILF